MQDRLIAPGLAAQAALRMPWLLRLAARVPPLRRIPAWFIGVGAWPEQLT